MTPCLNHPSTAATKTCVQCGSYLCVSCASDVIDGRAEQGYAVCRSCRGEVPPHIWNPHAAGADDDPGLHLVEALRLKPRAALIRAAWEAAPLGSLLLVNWLGLLGLSWLAVAFLDPAGSPAFTRFGHGLGWSLPALSVLAIHVAAVQALQPEGSGAGLSLWAALQLSTTAFVPPAIGALGVGLVASLLSLFTTSVAPLYVLLAVACGLGALGVERLGRGLALRRGVALRVGVLRSAAAAGASLLVLGLTLLIYLFPPWGSAWDQDVPFTGEDEAPLAPRSLQPD